MEIKVYKQEYNWELEEGQDIILYSNFVVTKTKYNRKLHKGLCILHKELDTIDIWDLGWESFGVYYKLNDYILDIHSDGQCKIYKVNINKFKYNNQDFSEDVWELLTLEIVNNKHDLKKLMIKLNIIENGNKE
jgi:hypothetical protein